MQKKRVRDVLIKFYVLPEERELIELKMKMTKYKSMSAYLRQAACYNKVIVKQYDFGDFKQMNKELNAIGVNINQLVARVNSTDNVYKEDLEFLKEKVQEIWQLQKSILSKLR